MSLEGHSDTESVTGTIVGFTITKGVRFSFRARRKKHPKYGPQLQITGHAPLPPEEWTDGEVVSFFTDHGKNPKKSGVSLDHLLTDVGNTSFLVRHLRKAFPEGGFAKAFKNRDTFAEKVGPEHAEALLTIWDDFSGLFTCHRLPIRTGGSSG